MQTQIPHQALIIAAAVLAFGTKRSLVQIQPPRLSLERSPSARTSKGFLVVGIRVTSSKRKFKHTISKILRFVAKSAVTHFTRRFCESSDAFTAMSAF